ncbi:PREDICTED: zinc finger protein CONSTANS-LIKE 5-like [Nelumbo nucifera]|uniref:Zinc finger protein CONSTANS-LIKE 5-like n=1 Tax=Nelumbo nucifera TaxID=4432 RepID=A0A1U7ZFR4_NELNU|nr:PREDICTED: zinc finger protein CONSTANS-LIKE 5-like [Nelumbo nucifera]
MKSNSVNLLVPEGLLKSSDDDEDHNDDDDDADTCREEAEAASWLLPNPNPAKLMETPHLKTGDYFFSDVDPYLDLDYASSMDARYHHQNSAGADSVVPVHTKPTPSPFMHPSDQCFDMDFCRSKPSYSYTTPSLSQSVSSSSLDVGVVPDGSSNTISDISNPFGRKGGIDGTLGAGNHGASQLSGMDREARVLRYREKRKNRKFEKTIRYASRKAYAETRPRIKGRFAKRTEIEIEVDRIYSSAAALMADTGYGIVPSF